MSNWILYIIIPLIAAAIGWFTNYIAVKMLFRPRKKIRFLFFDVQGIFPKRQAIVAEKIGKMVANELLSTEDIKNKISNPENVANINNNLELKIDEYLNNTFPDRHPFMAIVLNKKRRLSLKKSFMKELETATPEVINDYVDNLEESFDVEKMIRQKVALLSPVMLEELIMGILKREFQFIELIGAILGFIIGLLQVIITSAVTGGLG